MQKHLWRLWMKLNNFFDKSKQVNTNQKKVISVVNEKKENALKQEIDVLQAEIDRLNQVEVERNAFNQRMQSAETLLQETLEREVSLKAKNGLLEDEIKDGDSLRELNQTLTNNLRDTTGHLELKDNDLTQAAQNNLELNKRINGLEEENTEYKKVETDLRTGLEESIQRSAANKHELQEIKTNFSEIEVKLATVTEDYDNLKTDYDKLNIVAEYWKKVSETMQAENEDLEQTSEILKQLRQDVKVERTQQKGANKVRQNEVTTLQGKLNAMTETLEQLTYKNRYLLNAVSSLRKEVTKPRYLSMGSIAQKEGFKMPFGNENVRKQFLGTSAPTLLKFKEKEGENDN